MKKMLGLAVFVIAVFIIAPATLQVYSHYTNNDRQATSNMPCHRNIANRSYEWYYAHLSENDQQLVDSEFIRLLNEVDFATLDEAEQNLVLRELKSQLVEYIIAMEFDIFGRP